MADDVYLAGILQFHHTTQGIFDGCGNWRWSTTLLPPSFCRVARLSTSFHKFDDVFSGDSRQHDKVLVSQEDPSCQGEAHS